MPKTTNGDLFVIAAELRAAARRMLDAAQGRPWIAAQAAELSKRADALLATCSALQEPEASRGA
jgi:hypothetical protein